MGLTDLIGKGGLTRLMTATSATLATHEEVRAETVATVATVTVANLPVPAMAAEEDATIRAWLAHIEETDPDTIEEVLSKCQNDLRVRDYLIHLAGDTPSLTTREARVTCGDCIHFERIDHPNLGHCQKGEQEAIAGLWDSDRWHCDKWQGHEATQGDR